MSETRTRKTAENEAMGEERQGGSWKRVTLNGVRLWVARERTSELDGALAPEHHVGPDGELDWSRIDGPGYAHVYGVGPSAPIRRHGDVIGTFADLVDGWPERAS